MSRSGVTRNASLRAAIYVWVSNTLSASNVPGFEQNPEVQEMPSRQMAERRGWRFTAIA
jgi:hypothetical protein